MIAATGSISINTDSRLSDDVLMLAGLPLNATARAQIATALDSTGCLYYFAIVPQIGLVELTLSAGPGSAVAAASLPSGANALEMVAFCDRPGDGNEYLHVFWSTGSSVLHAWRTGQNDWAGPETLQACAGLTVSQRYPGPYADIGPAVCGVTSANQLVVLRPATDSGGAYAAQLLPGNDAGAQPVAVGLWAFAASGGTLSRYNLQPGSMPYPTPVSTGVSNVTRIFGAQPCALAADTLIACLLVFGDDSGAVHAATLGWDGSVIGTVCIDNGSGIVDGALAYWIDGACRFYGVSGDGTLFVARNSGLDANHAPTWSGLLPLDSDVARVACPYPDVGFTGTLALLAMRNDSTLDLMNQDGETQLWTRLPIQLASTTVPLRTTRYRTRIEVVDDNGVPCANLALSVTPASPVALETGGQFVAAAPACPAQLVTDATGVAEFSQPVTGLSAIVATVSASGYDVTATVVPHGYLTALLSAQSGAQIYTGTATIQLMSGDTLLGASVAGQPLAPALADTAIYPQPQTAATSFATWIQLMAQGPGSGASGGPAGFTLDMTTPGGPTLTTHTSEEALRAHVEQWRAAFVGSFWSDVTGLAGDIWHAVKHAAVAIATITVDAVNAVATLVVKIGDALVSLPGLALAGIHEAIATIHGVLAVIGADLEKVVDWLKDLFNWSTIWATMETFNGYVTSMLGCATQLTQTAKNTSQTFFADIRSDVNAVFNNAIEQLGDQTAQGARSMCAAVARPLLGDGSLPPPLTLPGSSTQRNWLLSKINLHLNSDSYLPSAPSILSTELLQQFVTAIESSGLVDTMMQAVSDFKKFILALGNPHALWQTKVADLLAFVRDIVDAVIELIDAIVQIALEVAEAVLVDARALLTTPLPDIPVLSWLWSNVLRPSGKDDPMTLSSLLCLGLAVPATLIGEITTGSNPFAAKLEGVEPVGQGGLIIISGLLTYFDVVNDCYSAMSDDEQAAMPQGKAWGWVDLLWNLVAQAVSTPALQPGTKIVPAYVAWSACFVPLAADLASCVVASRVKDEKLAKNIGKVTMAFDVLGGLGAIGTGVWAACEPDSGSPSGVDIASAVLGPLPWVTQFLLADPNPYTVAIQLVSDCVGDFVSTVI